LSRIIWSTLDAACSTWWGRVS